ncbi:G-PROTEIN-RECEP-F1-2 domain-containing protein [Aphelenchoides besseyi]|nr:G-PROTEIN-RECEP-F1-2 domain-containing protein [Aphelenchoides besseyi]
MTPEVEAHDDDEFFSNGTYSSILQNPESHHLLFSFMNLNLTLSDGRVVSALQMEPHDLVYYCHNPTVQRLAGFISELQTTQMDFVNIESYVAMRFILTTIFVIVGVLGFLGNLFTVAVIIRTPGLHSQTNYFLANLALSDLLLICVGVPFDLFYLWQTIGAPNFAFYCESTSTSISWFTYVSILTIVSMRWKSYIQKRTVVYTLIAIWIIAFIPSLLIGMKFKPVVKDFCGNKHRTQSNFGTCDYVGNVEYIFEIMILITFILPVLSIVWCYCRILRTLNAMSESTSRELTVHMPLTGRSSSENSFSRSGQLACQARASGAFKSQKAQRSVVKMLVIVAAVFFFSYFPYHCQRIFVNYSQRNCNNSICHLLYPLSGLLQYVSATLNPIIFNLMNLRFRKAFFALCGSVLRKRGRKASLNTIPLNLKG